MPGSSATEAPPATAEDFKRGMRQLAAGVMIITTQSDGQRTGLTATAVCSLSAEPPQLLVCINRDAHAHDVILESGRFCVNVLARHHEDLAKRFAGMDQADHSERFNLGDWETLTTGAPALVDGLANFDCEVVQVVESSTHCIFIGRVVGVRSMPDGQPLIYGDGRFAGLAANG